MVSTWVETPPRRNFYSPRLDYLSAILFFIGLTLKLADSDTFCFEETTSWWLNKLSPAAPKAESLGFDTREVSRCTLECRDIIRFDLIMSISASFCVDSIIELPFSLGDFRFLLVWCNSPLLSSSLLKLALDNTFRIFLSFSILFLLISFETFL